MQHSAFQRGAKVGRFIDCGGIFLVFGQADSGAALDLSPKSVQIKLEEGRRLIPFILHHFSSSRAQKSRSERWNLAQSLTSEHNWSVLQHHFQILSFLILFDPFSFTTQVAGRVCQLFPSGFRCAPYCPISLARCTNCLAVKVLPTYQYCAVPLPLVVEVFQQVQKL